MKKLTKILSLILTITCLFNVCVICSSCEDERKYEVEAYKNVSYGSHERNTLNLCLPKEKAGRIGLILMIHGGAWVAGDKDAYNESLEDWCAKYGYATAAINYRYISNEYYCEDIMQDVASSLEKIKNIAAEKALDVDKVLLTGGSAGGHLSLQYAYKYAETSPVKPVAVVNYSGPTDLTDRNYYLNENSVLDYLSLFSNLCHENFTKDNYKTVEMSEKMLESSPVNYVNENTVPTLTCHGLVDDVVPYTNATTLKAKLDKYGVKNDLITYKNSGHSLNKDKKQSKQAKQLFKEYAEEYLN